MTAIASISELLSLSNSPYRIFDLGRKLDKISKELFHKIELNQLPYPYPSQGHAFFAIAFWQKHKVHPYFWFIKLPLDERGLLNQGARNHYIAIIVGALGENLTVDPNEKQAELLKKNPYLFTPAQYKLAALNSIINLELKQKESKYFAHCQQYMTGKFGWDEWQNLGVQGINDFAVRLSDKDNLSSLVNALAFIPEQVLMPLCAALENQPLSLEMITAIIARFKQCDPVDSDLVKQQLIRSLASSVDHPFVTALLDELIENKHITYDLFIIIAGRCWSVLQELPRMTRFLELLVSTQEPSLFKAIFKDLVAIPSIRPILFQSMRSTERTELLAKAIGQLFQPDVSH